MTGVAIPVETKLVVGYEAPVADFLLDSALIHTQQSSLTLTVRELSLTGQLIHENGELTEAEELVENQRRPLGPISIEALDGGRIRIKWRNQTHELAPGERWIASDGDPDQNPALGFINFGQWPLAKLTTLQ